MKKIITLITMFVLSVSCLMAQGVFTYQAVVYNDNGDTLVVDKDVVAVVKITDLASPAHEYNETVQTHTSLNGLAVFSIGNALDDNFKNMDWSTAKISVDFKVGSSSVMAFTNEQIPAVPYALKAETKITTPMLVDYLNKATISEVEEIIDAMSPDLQIAVLKAIVDTVKDNYALAQTILLSYLENLDEEDAQQLYDSLLTNTDLEGIKGTLADILLDTLETNDGKEMMLNLVENYVSHLNGADVEKILGAMPDAVRNTVADSALKVLLTWRITEGSSDDLDPHIKDAIEEIAKDYLWHITYEEVAAMVAAVEGNTTPDGGAMGVLQAQFNAWMDQYVDSIVKAYMMEAYYYCESGAPRDVCGTTTPCLSAPEAFTIPTNDYDYYTLTVSYPATETMEVGNITSVQLIYHPYPDSGDLGGNVAANYYYVSITANTFTITIPQAYIDNFVDNLDSLGGDNRCTIQINLNGMCGGIQYVQALLTLWQD